MTPSPRIRRSLAGALLLYCLLLLTPPAAKAQGCAMCRETASYQKARAIDGLKTGIILLAIPPLAIVAGIGWLTYRRGQDPADW